jgi:hypothetical protein
VRSSKISCLGLVLIAALGCDRRAPEGLARAKIATPAASKITPLSVDATLPPALAQETNWQRATNGDPADLSSLARELGASALLDWIDGGGRAGWVALQAYVFADDAWSNRAALCELLPRVENADRGHLLAALQGTLQRAGGVSESVEPDADRRCLARLEALEFGTLSPRQADLCASVRQLLFAGRRNHSPSSE